MLAALGVTTVTACNGFQSEEDPATARPGLLAENLGCVQGTVIDGLTREGIDLPALSLDAGAGIRAMVGGTAVPATPSADFLGRSSRTSGEYSVCNVPLDESYNLIVDLPGYQRVEGLFEIASTLPNRASEPNEHELIKRVPTEIINIVVYPIGVQTGDLTVSVTHEGKALPGARVQLLNTGVNKLDREHNYELVYTNVKALPLALDTDDAGVARFKAESLVLGATYQYRVFPPKGADNRGFAEGQFTLGLVGNDAKGQPYQVHVELNEIAPDLRITSTNALLSANGQAALELVFNRPVSVLFDTEDELKATLVNARKAELVADMPGNGRSEQVTIALADNRVVLTPVFKTAPDAAVEPALEAQFTGLRLKAADDTGTLATWKMPAAMTVKVFGGVNQAVVPTSIHLAATAAGDNQSGPADLELPLPLAVQVEDQYGKPVPAGTPVTYSVDFANGVLRNGTATSDQKLDVATDATGTARVYWRLPKAAGAYQVKATIGSLPAVTFQAKAVNWVKQVVTSTVPATAPAATELPAFTIQLYDQQGAMWIGSHDVVVATGADSGKVREYTAAADTATQRLTAATDASGRLTVVWALGTKAGNQLLTVSVPGTPAAKEFTVNATPRLEALVVAAKPDSLVVKTDGLIKLELRDQAGLPLAPGTSATTKVKFVLEVGTGTLRGVNDAAGTGANVYEVLPSATGIAEVKFNPADVGDGTYRISATYLAGTITRTVTMTGTVKAAP